MNANRKVFKRRKKKKKKKMTVFDLNEPAGPDLKPHFNLPANEVQTSARCIQQ